MNDKCKDCGGQGWMYDGPDRAATCISCGGDGLSIEGRSAEIERLRAAIKSAFSEGYSCGLHLDTLTSDAAWPQSRAAKAAKETDNG